MRCFIAIEFDETTKALLAKLQDSIRAAGVNGNFTHPTNFHLTMKFLGEIDHRIVNRLEPFLTKVASDCKPFVLEPGNLGKFNKGNRSIIWCGIEKNDELYSLQRKLMQEMAAEFPEFPDESGLSSHVTLVREAVINVGKQTRSSRIIEGEGVQTSEINFERLFEGTGKPDRVFPAEGISLMESTREDGRLKYVRKRFFKFV